MKGKFVVCEGLDAAGKTTVMKHALKKLGNDYVYNKGLTSDTVIGKVAPKIPSTLTFLIELLYNTKRRVKPFLESGKTVLQDRYYLSVLSHVPSSSTWYNKVFVKLFEKYLLKPDTLVYFTVSKEERIKRLLEMGYNKHHYDLISNPTLIDLREEKYSEFYNKFKGTKYKIDTTGKSLDTTIEEFVSGIVS